MPIFIKENEQLKNDMFKIPDDVMKHLKTTLSTYGEYKKSNGYKRLNTLVNKDYNKRSNKEDAVEDDDKHITFNDLKRIYHDFKVTPNNKDDLSFILNGGDTMKDWVSNSLRRARNAVKPTLKVHKQQTLAKNILKPSADPTKPIKSDDKSTVYIHENNLLKENEGYHPYYDRVSDYDERFVLYAFKNNENIWTPLIQPEMYQKALSEFTRYGSLTKFPTKYVYQWMGIIMKNTAILRAMTDLAGHSQWFPIDSVIDVFFEDDEDAWEEYKNKIGEEDNYSAAWKMFEEIGYDEWQQLPDGTDAISDFGIEPLEKIIMEYKENSTPEETLVIVNKALDVTHCRGDLSSMFIRGGYSSLNAITYRQNESKSITEGYIAKYIDFDNKSYNPKSVNGKILPKNQLVTWFRKAIGVNNFNLKDISKLLNYYDIKPLQNRYFLTNDNKQINAYSVSVLVDKTLDRDGSGKFQLSQTSELVLNDDPYVNKNKKNTINNGDGGSKHEMFMNSMRGSNPEDFKEPTSWEKEMNNESTIKKKIIIKESQLLKLGKN